jgi:hypothetical protein
MVQAKGVMNSHEFREFPRVPGTGSPYIGEPVELVPGFRNRKSALDGVLAG